MQIKTGWDLIMLFIGLVRLKRNRCLPHMLNEFILILGHSFKVIGMNFTQSLPQQASNTMADDAIRQQTGFCQIKRDILVDETGHDDMYLLES